MRPKPAIQIRLQLLFALICAGLIGCADANQDPSSSLEPDNRWLVLNYWAEWCKPCLEEIPELNAFAAANNHRVRVVLVNFDGVSGDALTQQITELGIKTDYLVADPAATLGIERPQALPSTFIFNPDRQLMHTLLGPQTVASLSAATDGQ